MESEELFEAISHPLRIEIVKVLAEKPLRFADLKRKLKISSSGLLDFHLKKLGHLINLNSEGCYALTDHGFAALTTVESAAGAYKLRTSQKRSFFINLAVVLALNIYIVWLTSYHSLWYTVILPISCLWIIYYGYWTFVKRRIRLR